uniref:Peroxisomal membrane protein 11-1 n=1 Tax=Lygus hesperus TaxID=30085 RepID=A0A0A9WWL2_LYGHE
MNTQVNILTAYLAATDSRDKLLKGAGALFKLLGVMFSNDHYMKFGAATSDARSLMRLLVWVNNVKKLSEAAERRVVVPRDVLYITRITLDGVFALLDNVVYLGQCLFRNQVCLGELSYYSRAALFYGYVAAVLLDLYDLIHDKTMVHRYDRLLVLTRNVCDMVSCIGNVTTKLNPGVAVNSALGLLSAIIATRELYGSAVKAVGAHRAIGIK